jgi:hypothetical protein
MEVPMKFIKKMLRYTKLAAIVGVTRDCGDW